MSNKADKNSPVKWYDLPLVNAETYNVSPVCGKSETGIVFVSGNVQFEASPVAAQVIATLPEGYRPLKSQIIQFVSVRGNDGAVWATFGYVLTSGSIQFFNGTLPFGYIPDSPVSFFAVFPTN